MITAEYRGELAALCSRRSEELDAANINDVLRHIKKTYGAETYKNAKRMLITVDGESILLLQAFKTKLSDGQRVSFLPICGGG